MEDNKRIYLLDAGITSGFTWQTRGGKNL